MERETGFEPATPTLARLCSTPELFPPDAGILHKTLRKRNSTVGLPRWCRRQALSPRQAIATQRRLQPQVSLTPFAGPVRFVAGLDCAFTKDRAFGVVAVWDAKSRALVAARGATAKLRFPYIPGLLSFREAAVLLRALAKVPHAVDALMCDGQGIAHPRRFGLACHLGLAVGLPACGAAKSLLVGEHGELAPARGATTPLTHRGERVGTVLRTRDATRPIYSSPGHLCSIDQAAALTLECGGGYRMPEPTRLADRWAAMLKRGEITQRGLSAL